MKTVMQIYKLLAVVAAAVSLLLGAYWLGAHNKAQEYRQEIEVRERQLELLEQRASDALDKLEEERDKQRSKRDALEKEVKDDSPPGSVGLSPERLRRIQEYWSAE